MKMKTRRKLRRNKKNKKTTTLALNLARFLK